MMSCVKCVRDHACVLCGAVCVLLLASYVCLLTCFCDRNSLNYICPCVYVHGGAHTGCVCVCVCVCEQKAVSE